jgi:hypothetical protein
MSNFENQKSDFGQKKVVILDMFFLCRNGKSSEKVGCAL